jgi:hypothetical protein
MNPHRWGHIRRVFLEALALERAKRPAFLARHCDGDPTLRRDVEALLDADTRAGDGGFIRDTIAAVTRDLSRS